MRGVVAALTVATLLPGCDWIERRVDWLDRRRAPDLLTLTPDEQRHVTRPIDRTPYQADVSPRECWQVHSSLSGREALIDGDPATVASSTSACKPGQWIMLDFGKECCFQRVIQHHPDVDGFPAHYRVDVARSEGYPYHIEFLGAGSPGQSVAVLKRPVRARFIRITVLEKGGHPWMVSELQVR